MKKILIMPKTVTGIIDIRKQDYSIIENVYCLEQINDSIRKNGKRIADYKFCQFEEADKIPCFVNVSDKLTNGFSEFECKRIKFKNAPTTEEEKKEMLEYRHIAPLKEKMQKIVYEVVELIAMERLGDKIKEDDFIQLGLQKDKLKEEISSFQYQEFLTEIV